MGAMSARLRGVEDAYGAKGFAHWCPGCKAVHVVWYHKGTRGGACWTWDGNAEAPTTSPSIRLSTQHGTICHYFLKAGKIEYCGDCQHPLSGKTVVLPDWPYAPGTYGGLVADGD